MTDRRGTSPKYKVGIDVGTHSLGLAAIAFDELDKPTQVLNSMVVVHDSGIDPDGAKTAATRLAESGFARRARRRLRERRKRLKRVDEFLVDRKWEIGEPVAQVLKKDPLAPWKIRAELATTYIDDDEERNGKLAVAIQHIARHRGWRNPYSDIRGLYSVSEPSDQFQLLKKNASQLLDKDFAGDVTVGQIVGLVVSAKRNEIRLRRDTRDDKAKAADRKAVKAFFDGGAVPNWRKESRLLGEKLMQSDHANELLKIADVQRVDHVTICELINTVFHCKSPKGSANERVGRDPLPGQQDKPRASTASREFQEFRIIATLANMRIDGEPLNKDQLKELFNFLRGYSKSVRPTWGDVAEKLGVNRLALRGVAVSKSYSARDDGSVSASPPIDVVNYAFAQECNVKVIKEWWKGASDAERDALVGALSNQGSDEESPFKEQIESLLAELSDEDFVDLESLKLPSDRAAYSVDSLRRLTKYMLENAVDLHEARKQVFGVSDDWRPPADPIAFPVGNPAVDRVTKALNRWLLAIEREYGTPDAVHIEHVRDGFSSEKASREYQRDVEKRRKKKEDLADQLRHDSGLSGPVSKGQLLRYEAYVRQNHKCAYCLADEQAGFTLKSLEMDHIVPQAGAGSNNKRTNLVAVCRRCNASKSNQLFSTWAKSVPFVDFDACLKAVDNWSNHASLPRKQWKDFTSEVKDRMRRTKEDPDFDGRSIESVAWMANLVKARIEHHFEKRAASQPEKSKKTKVRVFNGGITHAARSASGFVGRIPFAGSDGERKTRTDRRHHAMDAAIIATLNESVARTLAIRNNLKMTNELVEGAPDEWKKWFGENPESAHKFLTWKESATHLAEVFAQKVASDEVPVVQPLRLSLGNGKAHDDTVNQLSRVKLGEAMSVKTIDNAATPALWCALTRHEDFDPIHGLPVNPARSISVNGTRLESNDEVEFFREDGEPLAALPVRNGYVAIPRAHHARVYRLTQTLKSGKEKVSYAMQRVFPSDLARHHGEDLFAVEIPPQSITMRCTEPTLRKALVNGEGAEYLGWIAVGDEIEISLDNPPDGIKEFLNDFPGTTRWRVDGFVSPTRLRLRPTQISGEGLKEGSASEQTGKVLVMPGWRPAVNMLFLTCSPTIIRRDSLGRVRYKSKAHFPVTWGVSTAG